jgi:hypothetical protein
MREDKRFVQKVIPNKKKREEDWDWSEYSED